MDDFSALASAPEEDNEIDDFEISSFSVSLDLFAPYSVNSLLLVSVYLVEPRSPKIHPVVRYCRLLC